MLQGLVQSKTLFVSELYFRITQSAFYFIRERLFRTERSYIGTHTLPGFLKSDKFQYDSFELKCLSEDIQKSKNNPK